MIAPVTPVALLALGDRAVRASLPEGADPRALFDALRAIPHVEDVVIAEAHVAIYGDFDRDAVRVALEESPRATATDGANAAHHIVRVAYDGEDLDEVARACGLSSDEVIARHVAVDYRVRFLGFLPGFAYVGTLDAALRVPRRAAPRMRIAKGSVAIAAEYTGIYPHDSPGGWNLIGRAIDFAAFDPARGATLLAGDRVRFEAT